MLNEKEILIYTDGACLGNPGPGGFGWVIDTDEREIEYSESSPNTTNNRMEISAVISSLSYILKNQKSSGKLKIKVFTDSQLVTKSINQHWLKSWIKNGWRKSDKSLVKNPELWEELNNLLAKFDYSFEWVKGHSGHPMNERCDELATTAAAAQSKPLLNIIKKKKLIKISESQNKEPKTKMTNTENHDFSLFSENAAQALVPKDKTKDTSKIDVIYATDKNCLILTDGKGEIMIDKNNIQDLFIKLSEKLNKIYN